MGKVMLKAYLYVVFFAAFFLINACVNAASFSVDRVNILRKSVVSKHEQRLVYEVNCYENRKL